MSRPLLVITFKNSSWSLVSLCSLAHSPSTNHQQIQGSLHLHPSHSSLSSDLCLTTLDAFTLHLRLTFDPSWNTPSVSAFESEPTKKSIWPINQGKPPVVMCICVNMVSERAQIYTVHDLITTLFPEQISTMEKYTIYRLHLGTMLNEIL